jgi:hypothetical protein
MGRTVTVPGTPPVTGVLVGVLPVRDRVTLALIVGKRRAWTDALDANTPIEVWPLKDAPRVEVGDV